VRKKEIDERRENKRGMIKVVKKKREEKEKEREKKRVIEEREKREERREREEREKEVRREWGSGWEWVRLAAIASSYLFRLRRTSPNLLLLYSFPLSSPTIHSIFVPSSSNLTYK